MTSGFEREDEEPKDYTKWIWLGVIGVVIIMMAALAVTGRQSFGGKSVVRVQHILITFDAQDPADRAAAFDRIKDIRARLVKGEKFSKLAKEFSDDVLSRKRGGDLGFVPKGDFDEAFEKFAWSAPVGELSDIINTKHGFHVAIVLERHLSETDAYQQKLVDKALKNDAGEGEGEGEAAPAEQQSAPEPAAPAAPAETPAAPQP